jgi:hypothetical protein
VGTSRFALQDIIHVGKKEQDKRLNWKGWINDIRASSWARRPEADGEISSFCHQSLGSFHSQLPAKAVIESLRSACLLSQDAAVNPTATSFLPVMASINILKFGVSSPSDTSPLEGLKAAGYKSNNILAVIGKSEGT